MPFDGGEKTFTEFHNTAVHRCAALAFAGRGAYNGFFTDEGFLSQENCTRAQQPLLGFGVFRA